jgi:hypothetical protein
MNLSHDRLAFDLNRFITPSYPEMEIRAIPAEQDPARIALYFTEPKFALLYPYQRL